MTGKLVEKECAIRKTDRECDAPNDSLSEARAGLNGV